MPCLGTLCLGAWLLRPAIGPGEALGLWSPRPHRCWRAAALRSARDGGRIPRPFQMHLWLKKKYALTDTVCQPNSTRPDSTRLDQAPFGPFLVGPGAPARPGSPLPAQDLPGFPGCQGRSVPGARDRGVDQFGHSATRSILPDPGCIALENCALRKTGPHLTPPPGPSVTPGPCLACTRTDMSTDV